MEIEKQIDAEIKLFKEHFELDSDTINCPSGLRWKKAYCKKVTMGKMAGTKREVHGNVYYRVQFKGKWFYAHHIVAALIELEGYRELRRERILYGDKINHLVIDHVNGTELGNVKGNLRVTTNQQNTCNKKAHREGDKLLGANWKDSENKWHCIWHLKYLASFPTAETAHNAYNLAETMNSAGFSFDSIVESARKYAEITKDYIVIPPENK